MRESRRSRLRGWIRRFARTTPTANERPARYVASVPVPCRPLDDGPTVNLPPVQGPGYRGLHLDARARNRQGTSHHSRERKAVGL